MVNMHARSAVWDGRQLSENTTCGRDLKEKREEKKLRFQTKTDTCGLGFSDQHSVYKDIIM